MINIVLAPQTYEYYIGKRRKKEKTKLIRMWLHTLYAHFLCVNKWFYAPWLKLKDFFLVNGFSYLFLDDGGVNAGAKYVSFILTSLLIAYSCTEKKIR